MGSSAQHGAAATTAKKAVSGAAALSAAQQVERRRNTYEVTLDAGFGKRLLVWLFSVAIILVLLAGWANRTDTNLSADEGLGYTLGLVGGITMLLLFLYPLRKKVRILRHLGAVKYWFQIHMFMGVTAPILIMFHSNFSLGSLNSNLAMFSMLAVVGSGLIGRYIYGKIHYGLYGQRAGLQDLRHSLKLTKGKLSDNLNLSRKSIERIKRLEVYTLASRGFLSGMFHLPFVTFACFWTRITIGGDLRHALHKQAKERGWDKQISQHFSREVIGSFRQYIRLLQKVAQFNVYEKLFGLWHVVHVPLFIMLVISGFVHVFAVHSY
jgi:hypothetical protein